MIPCQRHLFDIPEDIAYFNCGYMSPFLKSATKAGIEGIQRKSSPWAMKPADFFTESQQARELFASLINANAEDIAITPSASYGLAVAANNLTVQPDQHILLLEEQFPSNVYCWQELCHKSGGEILTVKTPIDYDWTSAVLAQISEKTAIAALPHNMWTNGGLLDLEKIGARLRDVGAALVLDVTQSLGAMPLDVTRIKPDFLAVASYKWLLGPYSTGFLYAAPKHQQGIPLEHNYLNRKGSQDFSRLVDYQEEFQPGASRYDMGERANFALMPVTIAALTQILDWGVADIYSALSQRTSSIAEAGQAMGLKTLPRQFRAEHFLGLEFDDGVPATLLADLAADNIFVSVRGKSLRITPHLYVTDHDCERLISALAKALGQ